MIYNSNFIFIESPSVYKLHKFKCFSIAHSLNFDYLENEQFNSIITSEYIFSKSKFIYVYFINEFNSSHFTNKISSIIPKDFVYTVFIKVRYNIDSIFMVGSQFGFNFSSTSEVHNLFTVVMSRL